MLTQTRYGINNIAAGFENFQKSIIKSAIEIQRKTISSNATKGWCMPKKMIDHKKFRNNCTENKITKKFLCFFNFFCKIKNNDTAIKKYSVVQTGPKTQGGGLNGAFCKVAYQVGIEGSVKIVPKNPTPSQTIISANNFIILFICVFWG
jgi:hypothetical protein